MPKNKGGKGFKKKKNEVFDDKHMIFKEEGQYYGLVTKMLGSGRVECYCYSDRGGTLSSTKHIGIIRGAMRKKKIWVSVEDIVAQITVFYWIILPWQSKLKSYYIL